MKHTEKLRERIAKLQSFLPIAEAADRGEQIQFLRPCGDWVDTTPHFYDDYTYRIKPKPPVERWAAQGRSGEVYGYYISEHEARTLNPGCVRYFKMREATE